jgi:glycosyltransferase involved in cell wall biosynthesis
MQLGLVIGQLTVGGAEGQLYLLCRGLDRAAVRPIVYCLSDRTEPYGPLIEGAGVTLRIITGDRPARVRRLRRLLNADGIDVVHAWLFVANAYAWLATRGTGRLLLTSARNCKRQGGILDWLNRRAFAASDAIVANSQQVAEYIRHEYGAPRERVCVVHNAVDTERFRPASDARPSLCVVMIGRLVPQKNPQLFVAAAAAVRAAMPGGCDIRFLLIGDGPLRAQVEADVAAAGLQECCTVMGERRDTPELLRQADLFWLTSGWEGLPNVVLEAMASGLPVVATDVGGTRELIRHGQDGFLIKAGDRDALVAHSLELLRDGEKRRQCSCAARARAEAFAPQRMVTAMQELYVRTWGCQSSRTK